MTSILIAVTGGSIAHTMRPLPIALHLRQLGARVIFGGTGPFVRFLVEKGFPVVPLPMLDYARVCKMMDSELFHLYSVSEYRSAVDVQRGYLHDLRPDLVLQDGPDMSLPVAAFEAGIKHVNLANATVFGLAGPQNVVPFRPWLPKKVKHSERWTKRANSYLIAQRNLRLFWPSHVYLAQRGLSPGQIPQYALLPDLPELFNARTDVAGKVFIGPLLYEPEVPYPAWWKMLDNNRPLVYVGVGSSGGATAMRTIIEALAGTEYQVVLSTVNDMDAGDLPANFFAARLVPRDAVLRRAAAMVYHGGSATTYQAIRNGVPMVAIPAHFDHDMNARAVASHGLGISIYPYQLTIDGLRKAVEEVIDSPRIARSLKKFQLILARRRPAEQGAELLLKYATHMQQPERVHTHHNGWLTTHPVVVEEVACDLCGETENHNERTMEGSIVANKRPSSTVRCKKCGLVYCSPRPDQTSLWLLEPLEKDRNSTGETPKMQHGAELRAIRRFAKVDLQSRVLIAGCGSGRFAQYLLEQVGCETLCVEEHPALIRRARARGLSVKMGAVGDLPDEDSGFDLILFLDSLERMSSPKAALASARERLGTGGRIIIKTANGARTNAAVDPTRALYAFTANTMNALLQQTRFTDIRFLHRRGSSIYCTAIPEIR